MDCSAHLTVAGEDSDAGQAELGREVAGLESLVAEEVGGEVFLVVVGEDGDDDGVAAELFLQAGGEGVAAGGDVEGRARGRASAP